MPRPKSRSPRQRHKDRRSRSRSRSRSPYYKRNPRRSRSPYRPSHKKSPVRSSHRPSSTSHHPRGSSSSSRDHRPVNKEFPPNDSRSRHHSSGSANKSSSNRREQHPVKTQQSIEKRRNSRSPARRESQPDFIDSTQQGWDPYSSSVPQEKQSPPRGAPYNRQRSYSPGGRDTNLLFPARSSGIQDLTMVYPSEPRMLIGRRFHALETEVFQPPVLEENITIGIHRKGPNMRHDPDLPVKRGYNPRVELSIHRKDEGKKPLFDREEIKKFCHDDYLDEDYYEEKRTISVKHTSKSSRSHHKEEDKRIVQQPDSRKIVGSHRSSRSGAASPKIKFDPRPDPRYEEMFRTEEKFRLQEKPDAEKVQRNPNDLRYSLLKRRHTDDDPQDRSHFDARKKIEEKRKQMDGGRGDRRRDRSHERNPRDRSRDRNRSSDSRKEDLPDFSNRPGRQESMDKFVMDEWKDKPEMIPKNPMYYEHDNRDGDNFSSRGRTGYKPRGMAPPGSNYRGVNFKPNFRGRFRSRGSGFRSPRGSFTRGRGSFSTRPRSGFDSDRRSTGTWKHDKYEDDISTKDIKQERSSSSKMDDKEDNKPTSTTSH